MKTSLVCVIQTTSTAKVCKHTPSDPNPDLPTIRIQNLLILFLLRRRRILVSPRKGFFPLLTSLISPLTKNRFSHRNWQVVIVDNHRASIGGLDLCFGRWDTHTHPLADAHPTHFERTLFPGQDYNNARLMHFQGVDRYADSYLSVLQSPRMPWHDVHMTLTGEVVLDIVQHFTERWNEIKKRKVSGERAGWGARCD